MVELEGSGRSSQDLDVSSKGNVGLTRSSSLPLAPPVNFPQFSTADDSPASFSTLPFDKVHTIVLEKPPPKRLGANSNKSRQKATRSGYHTASVSSRDEQDGESTPLMSPVQPVRSDSAGFSNKPSEVHSPAGSRLRDSSMPNVDGSLGTGMAPERESSRMGNSSSLDPPSRLIAAFLERQKETGEQVIDMDLSFPSLPDWLPHPHTSGRPPPSPRPADIVTFSAPLPSGSTAVDSRMSSGRDGDLAQGWGSWEKQLDDSLGRRRNSSSDSGSESNAGATEQGTEMHMRRETGSASGRRYIPPSSSKGEKKNGGHPMPARLRSRVSRMSDPSDHEVQRYEIDAENRSGQMMQANKSGPVRSDSAGTEGKMPRSRSSKFSKLLGKSAPLQKNSEVPKSGKLSVVDEDDPFKEEDVPEHKKLTQEGLIRLVIEWVGFVLIIGALVVLLLIQELRNSRWLTIAPWKWDILLLVLFCGRLVSGWIVSLAVFLIERNFLLRKRVLYFVYGLRRGVCNCLWLGLVLLVWHLIFDPRVEQSHGEEKALHWIARGLDCLFISSIIVLFKQLMVKVVASRFHVTAFFDRIQETLFSQYVLDALSGPPREEMHGPWGALIPPRLWYDRSEAQQAGLGQKLDGLADDGQRTGPLNIDSIQGMRQETVSAWSMKRLMRWVRTNGVATYTDTFESEAQQADQVGEKSAQIVSEHQATVAARHIFANVAQPGASHLEEEDLKRFIKEEDVARAWALFDGSMNLKHITKRVLKNWVVDLYRERKALALSLTDSKTAIKKLNSIVTIIVWGIILIIWVLILGIATTHLLLLVSSQLLLVVFMFGNTAKMTFESIIFLFVMHPYDVGDRCVIDGNQMVVEEMNVLTTVFLGGSNEKVWYPNNILASKPIANYYRSPDMGDSFEFTVDAITPASTIDLLIKRVKSYVEANPHYFHPQHSIVVLAIEDMSRMEMSLGFQHTCNHHDLGQKVARRSELILHMKALFEELGIRYTLPPQDVRLSGAGGSHLPLFPLQPVPGAPILPGSRLS